LLICRQRATEIYFFLLRAMLFSVMLCRFLCMLICMEMMGVSGVGMVGCMFVLTSSVGLSSLAVMLGAFFAHCFKDVSG
jgi:hypothetical protein